jgi:hypothetical protein
MTRTAMVPLLVLGLMLLGTSASPRHEHGTVEPAWYDDVCPFCQLGTDAGPPRIVDVLQSLPLLAVGVPTAPRDQLDAVPVPSRPRGPPMSG